MSDTAVLLVVCMFFFGVAVGLVLAVMTVLGEDE